MPCRRYCLILFWLASGCCLAQQPPDLLLPQQPKLLPGTALHSPDSADAKIRLLLLEKKQNDQRRDPISALNNLLLALALETGATPNTLALYELNREMGATVMGFNPRYALFFLKKAYAISQVLPRDENNTPLHIIGLVAGLHNKLLEPDSALHWYRLAIADARTYHFSIGEASAINNLGIFYANTGRHDSAMYYYRSALRTLGGIEQNTVLYCSIQDNIAQQQERNGNIQAALRTYRFNDSIYTRQNRFTRLVLNRIRLLTATRKAGLPGTETGIVQLAQVIRQHRDQLMDREALAFYAFAKDYFFETGSLAGARQYDSLYNSEKDSLSLRSKEQADIVANAFLNVQAIRLQRDAEVYRLESETARQSLRFTRQLSALLLLAVAAGLGFWALYQHKRRREHALAHRLTLAELRAKELEAQSMALSLDAQKRDITTVVLHNTQVLDNRRQLIVRLSDLLRQKTNIAGAVQQLITELQQQEQLNNRAQVVQENINRVNAEFYQTLSERFPTLSKSEVELCGYLRVDLSSKDIAILKNIAHPSVKMGKNRLRKKLGLGAEDDLYAFIQGI